MPDVNKIFRDYYRTERDRCERTLVEISEILTAEPSSDDAVIAILERLEKHWGREADQAAALSNGEQK